MGRWNDGWLGDLAVDHGSAAVSGGSVEVRCKILRLRGPQNNTSSYTAWAASECRAPRKAETMITRWLYGVFVPACQPAVFTGTVQRCLPEVTQRVLASSPAKAQLQHSSGPVGMKVMSLPEGLRM